MTQSLTKKSYFYTPEEYFAMEAEYKSEYHHGEVVAMAGASPNHNRISGNVFRVIGNALEDKPCEVFMNDLRLWVEQKNQATYPDVMVVCEGLKFADGRMDTITNPQIIIEVLSKSTEAYDRSDKFHAYWTLETLKEYVLIDQYRIRVEYFRRLDEKTWELRIFTQLDDLLSLKSIEIKIPLDKIYHKVTWEEE